MDKPNIYNFFIWVGDKNIADKILPVQNLDIKISLHTAVVFFSFGPYIQNYFLLVAFWYAILLSNFQIFAKSTCKVLFIFLKAISALNLFDISAKT